MRKHFILILLTVVLINALTGCREKENNDTSQVQGDVQGLENVNTDGISANSAFQITLNGDDEAVFTLNHEAVGKLEIIQNGDEGQIANEIQIYLSADNFTGEDYASIYMYKDCFDISETISGQTECSCNSNNGGEIQVNWDGNTVSANLQYLEIANILDKYTNYRVEYCVLESGECEILEEGKFADILTEVPAIVEPVIEVFLPDEFKNSEYDDQYFKPDSDDFVVIEYVTPINIHTAEWFTNRYGKYEYGVRTEDHDYQSTAKVTFLISYNGDETVSTKIRTEYETIDDAMLASLVFDHTIYPLELGLPDEPNDDLITADYFEECDRMMFENWVKYHYSQNSNDIIYQGHHDNLRYYEFLYNSGHSTDLPAIYLCDRDTTIGNKPIKIFSYSAGKTTTQTLPGYSEFTIYSSKRTYEAGSNDEVLEVINKLPGDSQSFTPVTEDYAYVLISNCPDQGDGYFNQEVYLYSFDIHGKIIQAIWRYQHSDYLTEDFEKDEFRESFNSWILDRESGAYYIDYLAEYEGGGLNFSGDGTPKENLFYDLTNNGQHEGFYFSKSIQ